MKNELLPIQPVSQSATVFSTPDQSCLTRKELAELLRVTVRTVDRIIAAGEIPVRRVRGSVRFLRSDVEQYLNAGKVSTPHPFPLPGRGGEGNSAPFMPPAKNLKTETPNNKPKNKN